MRRVQPSHAVFPLPIPRFAQRFDPGRWADDGFASPEESGHWSERSCGIACVRMCLAFRGLQPPAMAELLRDGLAIGGYTPRGWIHSKLAELAARHGLPGGRAVAADVGVLRGELAAGRPAIVSVTERLPEDGRRGGHLMVLAGVGADASGGETAWFRDPAGWGAGVDRVPLDRLLASYSGRAVVWADGPSADS
jgi:hypothetical protein